MSIDSGILIKKDKKTKKIKVIKINISSNEELSFKEFYKAEDALAYIEKSWVNSNNEGIFVEGFAKRKN
ncbi:hypothetical protein A2954_07435 [Candidatus Roizmanbacteria bacterium RIFCSPLOWO2_01_FULL_37_12]|uniref:Uncharacterized protein n=1 Tax=Candidatus Roizmanbacteria bacterium RIFCSPLOWO2_01_FULL_37_12 TaxID=1802056 RepID=A0A1F7IEB5_9BACT|nr:MAG: hypothetical protein A3D76_04545 [Candidatus Roizmanbacteria bacterium RIFCSPHIGHO2_02_FULL_37_9b]OGK41681.1 MAG: hypothetical protein A2954_07435 [Candidatus Roizmanbacteria bacterium RIFCSPLOWO2_01_FULL_37_12]